MVRRVYLSLFLGVVLAASGSAFAPAPVYRAPTQASMLVAMQGTWVYTFQSRDQHGRISTVTQQVEIENKTWRSRYTTKGFHPDNQEYAIVLDATKTPATLDLVRRRKEDSSVEMMGIVRWDGASLAYWYVTTWEKDATRPRSFDANERLPNGQRPYTMTLNRPK